MQLKKIGSGSFGTALLARSDATGELVVIKRIDLTGMPEEERKAARRGAELTGLQPCAAPAAHWSAASPPTSGFLSPSHAASTHPQDSSRLRMLPPTSIAEAAILSHLHHPAIIKHVESFEQESHLCIVTEFAEAGDLNNRLSASKGTPIPEVSVALMACRLALPPQAPTYGHGHPCSRVATPDRDSRCLSRVTIFHFRVRHPRASSLLCSRTCWHGSRRCAWRCCTCTRRRSCTAT